MATKLMHNAERYNFADFTREQYRRLLHLARKTYVARQWTDLPARDRCILWRHDVDVSVHAALKMAQIEAEEGVIATYFLRLDSEFYNLFEIDVVRCARDVLALGHQVGLHFNAARHGIEREEQLTEPLREEARTVSDLLRCEVRAFSFHNPTSFTSRCERWQYAGLINTYAEYFRTKVGYCSDSNGYWRFRRLEDVLLEAADERLQVLIHPEWWTEAVMSPRERVKRCIDGRAERTQQWYARLLRDNGRDDVDWE